MKKILLLMIIPYLYLSAATSGQEYYKFVVDNPTMVDAYFNIFNAMAGMFNSVAYQNLLKLVFLMGGFIVFFMGVLKSYESSSAQLTISEFTKYMLVGTALLTLIYSDKKSLVITTKNIPTYCSTGSAFKQTISTNTVLGAGESATTGVVVGNIPEILAWGFAFINEIGTESTRIAKTAFGSVNGTLITESPADFASYLTAVGDIMKLKLSDIASNTQYSSDVTLEQSLQTVINDCILIPSTADSVYGSQIRGVMFSTGDMVRTIENLIDNGTLVKFKNPTVLMAAVDSGDITNGITINGSHPGNLLVNYNANMTYCSTAWADVSNRLNILKNSGAIECGPVLKNVLNERTMKVLTGANNISPSQAKEIALNAGVTNVLFNSNNNIMASEMAFASGKSMAQFVNESMGTGYYMAQMLPYLQMGMRAILYAFFPFVFVVVLLPGGIKVLISYLQSLVWIELWSPTAAILDMFMELVSGTKFQEMYNNQGANMLNGIQTFSDTAMLASVAGYLYASVPALTWLILKGSGYMLGNISGAVASRMTSNLSSDSINKDAGELKKRDSVNDTRRAENKEAISLAEQDRMNAGFDGDQLAGKFLANDKYKQYIKNASSGATASSLSSGAGKNEVNKTAKEFEALKNMEETNTLKDANTGKLLELDKKSNIDKFAKSGAIAAAGDIETKNKAQNILRKEFGIKEGMEGDKAITDILSGVGGLEYAQKLVATDSKQQILADSLGVSKEAAGMIMAKVEAGKGGLDDLTNKKFLEKQVIIDKNGVLDVGKLNKTANTMATEKHIDMASNEKVQHNISDIDRIKANVLSTMSKTGENSQIAKKAMIMMQSFKDENVPGAAEKLKQMESMSPAQQALAGYKFSSTIGVKSDAASKAAGDFKATLAKETGVNYSDLAKLELGTKMSTINKNNETQNYFDTFKEVEPKRDEKGDVMYDKDKNIIPLRDENQDLVYKHPAEAKEIMKIEKDFNAKTNGKFNDKTKEGRAVIAQNTLNVLGANPGAYEALSKNAQVKAKVDDYKMGPNKEAESLAYKEVVDIKTQGLWRGIYQDEPMAQAGVTVGMDIVNKLRTGGAAVKAIFDHDFLKNTGLNDKTLNNLSKQLKKGSGDEQTEAIKTIQELIKNMGR